MLNYKFRKMKLFKNGIYVLAIFLLSITTSCNQDDDISSIIGGLDFVIATLNAEGNEVGVVASTVPGDNRIVYTIDFGDANGEPDGVIRETSGPMVRYMYPEETATYTITVTAALAGRADVSITKEHTVIFAVEPPPGGNGIEGTWRIAPEAGAFGVGPALGDTSWFSNSTDDVVTRACFFDDEYVFNSDGSFQNILGSETWVEPWQGAPAEECGAPVFPHDGTTSATYTYNPAGNITIDGTGAFLGLSKVYNGGELTSPGAAPAMITYIAALSDDGNTLELDIEVADGGYWSFKLVKDTPPEPSALDGTWRLAPVSGAFGVGPAMNDVSWFSSSSDDVTTRDCLFDDTYVFNADGSFQNVLGADTWLETWQGAALEGCGAPIFPHDGTATATYAYDAAAGTIMIDGAGAFLGLSKVFNGGELASPGEAPSSITYIAELSADGNTLDLDIEIADGGYWTFQLVRDVVPSGIQGTWKLAPESGAFGVGPAMNDVSWFSSSLDDVTTRDCLFDDEYVFNADGSFLNILGSETWLETWQGAATEGCGAPIFPHDGSASATYEYDEGVGTITIDGTGAFLGLSKVINGAELGSPGEAPSSVTYIAELSADGNTIDLDIEIADGGYWSFKLARQ